MLPSISAVPHMSEDTYKYDAFVSHASEDKESFVRPLAIALSHLGLKVHRVQAIVNTGRNASSVAMRDDQMECNQPERLDSEPGSSRERPTAGPVSPRNVPGATARVGGLRARDWPATGGFRPSCRDGLLVGER